MTVIDSGHIWHNMTPGAKVQDMLKVSTDPHDYKGLVFEHPKGTLIFCQVAYSEFILLTASGNRHRNPIETGDANDIFKQKNYTYKGTLRHLLGGGE